VKLTTIRPTLQVLRPSLPMLQAPDPDSWRNGKTTAAQRGYGGKWQRERAKFLAAHPLCERCEARGVVEAATVVDHRIPHRGDQKLFWDRKNWGPLCAPCHNAKTQEELAAERRG
jgi:5-methylcytosine-specific restriction enzyme A